MMAISILKIRGLSLISPNGYIVRDLSIDMKRGEIIALTGKSGSGKTSIAMAILDLLPEEISLEKGSIEYTSSDGIVWNLPEDGSKWKDLLGRHICFIQQDVYGAFDPVIRMGKQMLMIIRERKIHPDNDLESILRSALAETGIIEVDRILNSYPHQLSGGQLQRCLVCLAIVIQPSLIIADEPTSAIDKMNQLELLDLFSHIRKEYNISILCITHEPAVVDYLADREIKLDGMQNIAVVETAIDKTSNQSQIVVLEALNLGFTHRFGGIFTKKGAHISGIHFSLSPGNCIGIIGESGSGKSTFAQMLVGQIIPSEGILKLNGQEIDFDSYDEIRILRSKVQLVMQDGRGSLHPNKTIRNLLNEIINQRDSMLKKPGPGTIDVLAEVGLPSYILDRKQGQLSGGECLRISIARALLMFPAVLICDESTTSLDAPTRDSVLDMLRQLMINRDLGLILISHDQDVIRMMADHVIVLSEGTIVENGTLDELVSNPKHPATKKIFLSEARLTQKKIS